MAVVSSSKRGGDSHGALDEFFLQFATVDGIGFSVSWERGEFRHGKAE